MNTPDPDTVLDITGPKPESIFSRALVWAVSDAEQAKLQLRIDQDLAHVEDLKDDRLLVLLGAMIVENAQDGILEALMPGFSEIRKNRDISFSVRTEILRALAVIPKRFLGATDSIRTIRNDMAHNLQIKKFADLKPGKMESCRAYLRQFNVALEKGKDDVEVFKQLTAQTTLAMHIYRLHVVGLNAFVRTDAFHEALKASRASGAA